MVKITKDNPHDLIDSQIIELTTTHKKNLTEKLGNMLNIY